MGGSDRVGLWEDGDSADPAEELREGEGEGRAARTVSPKGCWGQDGVTECHNSPCPEAEAEVSPRMWGRDIFSFLSRLCHLTGHRERGTATLGAVTPSPKTPILPRDTIQGKLQGTVMVTRRH